MYYKYPRTFHLPWSSGITNEDKVMSSTEHFLGERVVVTEKMDGENTTMYYDHIHARSVDSKNHPSREWVKGFWASIKHQIPTDIRVCGENMYAAHSIKYEGLSSYFLGFSVWSGNRCWSWGSTVEFFNVLGINTVPILYEGIYNEELIKGLYKENTEGYVVRLTKSFSMDDFSICVGKFVRENHVQTDNHWMYGEVDKNLLQ